MSASRWFDANTSNHAIPPAPSERLLIHGDNLPALQALADTHRGAVQCVYLDPPYNTGATFEHYRDAMHPDAWLAMMGERLRAIQPLLAPTGCVCVQIDDRQHAYLQVLMDSIFGRNHRISTVVVKMSELSGLKMSHVDTRLPKLKEYILIYAASPATRLRPLRIPKSDDVLARYLKYYAHIIENPDAPVPAWRIVRVLDYLKRRGAPTDAASVRTFKLREASRVVYRTNNAALASLTFSTSTADVTTATGTRYIWWEGKQMLFLSDHCEEYVGDLWTDISTINLNKEGGQRFRFSKKPEALLERVIRLTTDEGDLVLDAFAGSGTTGAVAERLGRRWVMMEQGDHCFTHIVPRMNNERAVFRTLRLG